MYIIVGLGNPTKEYDNTRHNIGFAAIDMLADKYGINVSEVKHKALLGKGVVNGNKVILDDWRLPTEAELKIIMDIQGTGADAEAIDYLLNAKYYVSASGAVINSKSTAQGTAGRCVRDAYVK